MAWSRLASPSATRALLDAHGLRARKSLGQHFLIDDNVVGRIIDLARVGPGDIVLEVGPGIGTLTLALLHEARAVIAVEQDRGLAGILADTVAGEGRLAVVEGDAVTVPAAALVEPFGPPVALVANLPYNVAATVVLRCFEEMPSVGAATVMVQAEVADRMAATPGGKDYGAYTVKLRLLARPAGRFPVPRACFLPPPRVDSAVLRLERDARAADARVLRDAARVADAAFSQRRKTLRNSLAAGLRRSVSEVDAMLVANGIEGGRRAETLEVDEYLVLGEGARIAGLLP